jgi:Protein of unknown function (DUF4239)
VVINILIVLASVTAAVAFLFVVARTSLAHSRKESNDFTGAVVAVIGTTYAVLLAFMLSGVWNMYQQAEVNAEQEANDVVNIYHISAQLPQSTADQLQGLMLEYVQYGIQTEFPALSNDTVPARGGELVSQMWNVVRGVKLSSENEQIALGELLSTLRSLTEHRRIRIMQSGEMLPSILWTVLIAGGVITVTAACFFGVPNFRFHLVQVIVLSFLISLVLVAIADIDRPYQGDVRVMPTGFEFAQRTMTESKRPAN